MISAAIVFIILAVIVLYCEFKEPNLHEHNVEEETGDLNIF